MLITRKSMFTGKIHTLDLPITDEQLQRWWDGTYVQDAMPHLSADQREFVMTGVTPEEWTAEFGG